jgi:hypothetical protein
MEGSFKMGFPKGPSMNPAEKGWRSWWRTSYYSYKYFEGAIPEGNYGAGSDCLG